jgi:hypothetical protein
MQKNISFIFEKSARASVLATCFFVLTSPAYSGEVDVFSNTYVYKSGEFVVNSWIDFSKQSFWQGTNSSLMKQSDYSLKESISVTSGLGGNFDFQVSEGVISRNRAKYTHTSAGDVAINKASYLQNPLFVVGYGFNDFISGPLSVKAYLKYSPALKDNTSALLSPMMALSYAFDKQFRAHASFGYVFAEKTNIPDAKYFSVGLQNYFNKTLAFDLTYSNTFYDSTQYWTSYDLKSLSFETIYKLDASTYISPIYSIGWRTGVTQLNTSTPYKYTSTGAIQTYSLSIKKVF